MSSSKFDPSEIPVAQFADSQPARSSAGCLIGLVLAGLLMAVLAIMTAGIYILVNFPQESVTAKIVASPEALEQELHHDLARTKAAFDRREDPRRHRKYPQILKFVESMQAAVETSSDSRTQRLVDHENYFSEVAGHSESIYDSRWQRRIYEPILKQSNVSPFPFWNFEIHHIEDLGDKKYRVLLSYHIGHQTRCLNAWWLVEKKRRIKLFDWQDLDEGMRDAAQSSIYMSAPDSETNGYDRFIEFVDAYFEADQADIPYWQRKQRSVAALAQCENFQGPELLKPRALFRTAKRWNDEGKNTRALKLLQSIAQPQLVPGIDRLEGDIYYDRQQYRPAVAAYQRYADMVGLTPYLSGRLASCYMNLGDKKAEREMRLKHTEFLSAEHTDQLAQLMLLNTPQQNEPLLGRIDQLPDRQDVYHRTINWLGNHLYFRETLQQIKNHLSQTAPGSKALVLAHIHLAVDTQAKCDCLQMIDRMPEKTSNELRYSFWSAIGPQDLVAAFDSSLKKPENFDAISDIEDEEYIFDDRQLEKLCDSTLKVAPDHAKAHHQLAQILIRAEKYRLAIERLKKTQELVTEDSDWQPSLHYSLLQCYVELEQSSLAIELANQHDLGPQLFNLKNAANDFKDFQQLLDTVELSPKEEKYQLALWDSHRSNNSKSIHRLANAIILSENSTAYSRSRYQCIRRLVDLCIAKEQPLRAIELVKEDEVWEALVGRLAAKQRWDLCQVLLDKSKPRWRGHCLKLAQRIAWQRGQYQQIVDGGQELVAFASQQDASRELERLVQSALLVDDVDTAMKFARLAEEKFDSTELPILVNLHQNRLEESLGEFLQLYPYDQGGLLTDSGGIKIDLQQFERIDDLPAWKWYALQFDPVLNLEFLFDDTFEFDQGRMQTLLRSSFDAEVQIQKIETEGSSTWRIEHAGGVIFAAYCRCRNTPPHWLDEPLRQSMLDVTGRLKIMGFAKQTNLTNNYSPDDVQTTVDTIVGQVLQQKPVALASDNRWISFATAKQQISSGGNGEQLARIVFADGNSWYPDETKTPAQQASQRQVDNQFQQRLVAALKEFDRSTEPANPFRITIESNYDFEKPHTARVQRIMRSDYGEVTIIASIEPRTEESIQTVNLPPGSLISVWLDEILSFEYGQRRSTR